MKKLVLKFFGLKKIVKIYFAVIVIFLVLLLLITRAFSSSVTVISASDFQPYTPKGTPILKKTSDLAMSLKPDFIIAPGDISDGGNYEMYEQMVTPYWGRMMPIFYPAPGNHDFPANADGVRNSDDYFKYFSFKYKGQTANRLYYSMDMGMWHVISLNDNVDISERSEQLSWLKNDLKEHSNQPILAFWHKPFFSTSTYSDNPQGKYLWEALYAAHADIVVNGHVHSYQRFPRLNPNGVIKEDGIREFIDGVPTDGYVLLNKDDLRSAYRKENTAGFIKFRLRPFNYSWEYIGEDGSVYDKGMSFVHNPPYFKFLGIPNPMPLFNKVMHSVFAVPVVVTLILCLIFGFKLSYPHVKKYFPKVIDLGNEEDY